MTLKTQVVSVFITLLVFFGGAFVSPVFAQDDVSLNNPGTSFTDRIVPQCGGFNENDQFVPCEFCHLVGLGQNVINFLVAFTAIAATLMFVYAGFLYLTAGANPNQIGKAHSIFWSVLVGFIIVLIGWLVVDLILHVLAGQRLEPFTQIECQGPIDRSSDEVSGSNIQTGGAWCFDDRDGASQCFSSEQTCNEAQGITGGSSCTQQSTGVHTAATGPDQRTAEEKLAAEQSIREDFENFGITVNKNSCPPNAAYNEVAGGCTDVSGLRGETFDEVVAIRERCGGCAVVVTGGDEAGHKTHDDGWRVDLRLTDDLQTWAGQQIRDGDFVEIADTSLGKKYRDSHGNCWLEEHDHWHIDVGRCQ